MNENELLQSVFSKCPVCEGPVDITTAETVSVPRTDGGDFTEVVVVCSESCAAAAETIAAIEADDGRHREHEEEPEADVKPGAKFHAYTLDEFKRPEPDEADDISRKSMAELMAGELQERSDAY